LHLLFGDEVLSRLFFSDSNLGGIYRNEVTAKNDEQNEAMHQDI
jgi:hypothetical protein